MNITGKRVLITGGSSGIGLALAQVLLAKGAKVAISGRRPEVVAEAVRSLQTGNAEIHGIVANIATAEGRAATLEQTLAALAGLDILVNNAGGVRAGRLENIPEAELRAMIDVDLTATILLTRAALPVLRKSGDAMVVNVSSSIALVGAPFYATYAAVKAGVASFGESLRRELKGEGVHVLTAYPGATDTPMNKSNRAGAETGFPREPASAVADAIAGGIEMRAPSVAHDPAVRRWWSKFLRMSASPSAAVALSRANLDIDIRHLLSSIRIPTLIHHARHDGVVEPEAGRDHAPHIPGAQFVEIPSVDHVPFFDGSEQVLRSMEAFLNGAPRVSTAESKVLTLMVTDIVGSTRMAVERGDQRFRDLLDAHHETVRSELAQYRAEEINTTGDGFLASFDGPARAIRCAVSITDALHGIGIDCRIGLHTGECELRGGTPSGVAIHIAARVAALAPPNAILVTQTVRDLVAGAGLRFSDAGTHALKGLPEEWRLFSVVRTHQAARSAVAA